MRCSRNGRGSQQRMTDMPASGRSPETIRKELVQLLENFSEELRNPDVRRKVRALIPAYHQLRALGSSLVSTDQLSGRERILAYFLKYVGKVIDGDELLVVSGIGEWARRVRELRVEFGWNIVSGVTAKELGADELEELGKRLTIDGVDVTEMTPDQYVMMTDTQDREAAHRWNLANSIRGGSGAVRDKILQFLRANAGKPVSGEELRYVAKDRSEWARRVRELRTEFGWAVVTKTTGRPDLPVGAYVLEQDRQTPAHDRRIPDPVRVSVLARDNYRCQQCGWHHDLWNRSDARHLELHHRQHHARGGRNTSENLVTLCNICHDEIHRRG